MKPYETLEQIKTDLEPILRAYSVMEPASIYIAHEDDENGYVCVSFEGVAVTGSFLTAIASYLRAQNIPWVLSTFGEVRLLIG